MSMNGTDHHDAPPAGVTELGAVLSAILERLDAIEANTAAVPGLVAELDEFRPMLNMVRERAERGNFAARFRGGKVNPT